MTGPILVTGARAPVALDIARAFRAAGHEAHLADSVTCWAARWSRPAFPLHRLPSPRYAFADFRLALADLLARHGFVLIVPTCEEVFYVAEAAARDDYADRVFAPPLATLRMLHSKLAFIDFVRAAGVTVPATRVLTDLGEIATLPLDRIVLKPEYSRFAAAALIRPTRRGATRVRPSTGHRWVAQDYVAGEEVCLWLAAYAGKITACAVYRPRRRHGRSAAYAFEAIDCPAAVRVAETIAAATEMTGHLSFDLILTADGAALPIECNPRAVSGVHLYDADAALARAILGEPRPAPPVGRRRHLAPAMALLGLPTALATGSPRTFIRDWRAGADAIGRPGDPWPAIGAIADAARFAALGLTRRRSPTRQTTADIEWNGEPIE